MAVQHGPQGPDPEGPRGRADGRLARPPPPRERPLRQRRVRVVRVGRRPRPHEPPRRVRLHHEAGLGPERLPGDGLRRRDGRTRSEVPGPRAERARRDRGRDRRREGSPDRGDERRRRQHRDQGGDGEDREDLRRRARGPARGRDPLRRRHPLRGGQVPALHVQEVQGRPARLRPGAIAFFGGDPDNFTYPRYDLDLAIFRVYEDDQPVHPHDYLTWSATGPKDGDTVFVSGHPGHTDRMDTLGQLNVLRDVLFPTTSTRRTASARRCATSQRGTSRGSAKSPTRSSASRTASRPSRARPRGPHDAALMKKKTDDEAALRKAIPPTLRSPRSTGRCGTTRTRRRRRWPPSTGATPRSSAPPAGPTSTASRAASSVSRTSSRPPTRRASASTATRTSTR